MSRQLHAAIMSELLTAEGLDDIRSKAADSWDKHGCVSLHWVPKSQAQAQKIWTLLRAIVKSCQHATDVERVNNAQCRLTSFAGRKGWIIA
jgi:hypothetical protein